MAVVWEPPGPGQWAGDRSHMPAGTTPIVQHVSSTAMPAGMRRVFAELGVPLDTLECRFVNGHTFTRLRPLIGADKPATKLPPIPLLKVAVRVHPEMRRRNRTARTAMAEEPWKRIIADWHGGMRDEIVAQNLALQDVDLAALDDAGAVAHARRCIEHAAATWERHFWLHGYDLGPLGQYLHEAKDWGVPAEELLSLLEGASPSTSAPRREAAAIRAMVEATGSEPSTLDELRALSPEIDEAVAAYLRRRGGVVFSQYDLDGITLAERPDLVFATIVNAEDRNDDGAVAARTAAVRARVPEQHRPRFDELLRQARDAMDLRDDNGPVTAEWPLGLIRLAMLELGRRMATAGRADRPEHAFELRVDELTPGVCSAGPGAEELARRAEARQAQKALEPPAVLGPPEPAPPLDVLPRHLARLVGMVETVMAHLAMDGTAQASGLHGVGVGTEPVRGRARVATSPEEALDRVEPGDILVVATTTPAYNLVLSLAAGVVTAEGGLMSHAAVIARELGIPAVVGARAALIEIEDGAMVEVDPAAGEVRVLAAAG